MSGHGKLVSQSTELTDTFSLSLTKSSTLDNAIAFIQPIIKNDTQEVAGFEALLRQQMPDGSVRGPMGILQEAEEQGLQHELFMHMLEQSCQAIQYANAEGKTPDFFISINADKHTLEQNDIVDKTLSIMDRYGVKPHQIKVELVEHVLPAELVSGRAPTSFPRILRQVEERAKVFNTLHDFENAGVRVMVDDCFSRKTGFNNDARIAELLIEPDKGNYNMVSGIKIDKEALPSNILNDLIQELTKNGTNQAPLLDANLIETSVIMAEKRIQNTNFYGHIQSLKEAHKNGNDVSIPTIVVEGIEAEEDISFCQTLFDGMPLHYQAFKYHKPMPTNDAISLLPEKEGLIFGADIGLSRISEYENH